jgi:hypothetical protein
VPPEQVMATMRAAGFTQVERLASLGVFSEYFAVKAEKETSGN